MSRRSITLISVAVLVLVTGLMIWKGGSRSGSDGLGQIGTPSATSDRGQATDESDPLEAKSESPPVVLPSGGESDQTRASVDLVLSGRVELQDLERSGEARVLALPLDRVRASSARAATQSVWESVCESTRSSPLETDGAFAFDERDSSEHIVVVVEPSHQLTWTVAERLGTPVEVSASSASPVRVKVQRSEGETGGPLQLFALYSAQDEPGEGSDTAAALLLPVEFEVSEEGQVDIPRGGESVTLWAVSGEHRSAEWRGSLEDVVEITLDLQPTFSARGSLDGMGTFDPRPSGVRVSAHHVDKGERRRLASCEVDEQGVWLLPALPTDGASAVTFRLEGKGLATREKTLPAPEPGSEVEVPFDLVLPERLVVILTDFEQAPVPGADLRVEWTVAESTVFSSGFRTDEDGIGELIEAPAETVFIHIAKPGYSGGRYGPFTMPQGMTKEISLSIGRAGRIAGRCVQDGAPVEAFTIRYWQDSPWNTLTLEAADREDGSFVLEDAPLGNVTILASSPDCPGAPTQTVEVSADSEAWVEIELPATGTAMGRVVDASTDDPISTATVQSLSGPSYQECWPWGQPLNVNALGEFQGAIIAPPLTVLEITAPGYAPVTRRALVGPDNSFDCGTIGLTRAQALLVRLTGSVLNEYSAYSASVGDSEELVTFNSQGEANYPAVKPGLTWITIYAPDGSVFYLTERLQLGQDWLVEIPVNTGNQVRVEVRNPDGSKPDAGMWAGVSFARQDGVCVHRYLKLNEEGRAEFSCVPAGSIYIDIVDSSFQQQAQQPARVDPSGVTVVPVALVKNVHTVRFVDVQGAPVVARTVFFRLPGDPLPWGFSVTPDANGVVKVRGFDAPVVLATLMMTDAVASDLPVELGLGGEEPIEVVVDASSRLELRLLDGDHPLTGIRAFLRRWKGGQMVVNSLSDASGDVDFHHVAQGGYIVEVNLPGYWPTVLEVEASPEVPSYVMQVRRLGSLQVVVSRDGAPLAQAGIELRSEEFDVSLSEWVSQGRVEVSSPDLASNSKGEIVVHGIPHGNYKWTARSPEGTQRSGEVLVRPREMTTLPVDL